MKFQKFPQTPVAIVGMAARLPGAPDLGAFWELIRSRSIGYGPVPEEFLDRELYFHPDRGVRGKSYTTLGGIVPFVTPDPRICPISPDLMARCEPAHLTYAGTVAQAICNAGYDPTRLPTKNVGVYVGHAKGSSIATELTFATKAEQIADVLRSTSGFDQLPADVQLQLVEKLIAETRANRPARPVGPQPFVGAGYLPALIAEIFQFEGPHMALNAACASSLFSLAMGVLALDRGDIEMAVVGGASQIRGDVLVLFCQAQTCSAHGSFPFDVRADGMVPSDGYTAAILKALPRAQADGDNILGVITGIGLSSDGKGKSLWAPRKEGQVLAMQRAYGAWHDPALTQYLECHATATQVGDATEIEAVREFFQPHVPANHKIPIGSVKANIGHTLESAGMAGLIKLLLAMSHEVFPATPTQKLNESIPWKDLPVRVSNEEQPWPRPAGGVRQAGVNAFGIGGLNVHIIVEEAPQVAAPGLVAKPLKTNSNAHEATAAKVSGHKSANEPHANGMAIVGRGAILPGAFSVEELWKLMKSGQDPKGEPQPQRWSPTIFRDSSRRRSHRVVSARGGFISNWQYDWRKNKIPPKQLACSSPLQYMLLDCVDQALREAGLDPAALRHQRVWVVAGGGFGGEFAATLTASIRIPEVERTLRRLLAELGVSPSLEHTLPAAFRQRLLEVFPEILDETGSFTSSALASRISKHYDLTGGALAVDSGDASALSALMVARNLLEADLGDLVICAVGNRAMDVVDFEAVSLSGILPTDSPKSPFEARVNGHTLGEGAGVLLLKRLADAQRDGNAVMGVVRGLGAACSARQPGKAVAQAARQACEQARVKPADVGVIEIAGSGDSNRAFADLSGIHAVYGSELRVTPLHLTSGLAQFGSLLSAQGIVALLRASLSVERGEVLPTLGLTEPHSLLAGSNASLTAAGTVQPFPKCREPNLRTAGVAVQSDRGFAMHAILEHGTSTPAPPERESPEHPIDLSNSPPLPVKQTMIQSLTSAACLPRQLVRIGANSSEALLARLEQVAADPRAIFAAAAGYSFNADDRSRAVLVAEGHEGLAQQAGLAVKHSGQPELVPWLAEQGVFLGTIGVEPLRAAFMFAGQGSQYAGMLAELVSQDAAARVAYQEIEATLARLGHDSFERIAWQEADRLGHDVWATQISMLAADTILYRALTARGLRPAVVCGHSYGEYPALVAAGICTFEQAVRMTSARCQVIEASRSGTGGMLSTSASVDDIERILRHQKLKAYIANYNAPTQTIIGGTPQAIEQLEAALTATGALVKRLSVPRAFHTPLIADAKPALRAALRRERLRPADIPLLSSVSNRYEADPESIRDNLVDQLTEPVRYPDLVQRLLDDGIGLLVEVGPKQVLTGLHRAILQSTPKTHVHCIASDNAKQPGRAVLDRVQTMWECLGGVVDLAESAPVVNVSTIPNTARFQSSKPSRGPAVVHFDATTRRKESLKRAHRTESHRPLEPAEPVLSRSNGQKHAEPIATTIAIAESSVPSTIPSQAAASPDTGDLESYLITFVVDQTGYPPELVELDADLEADLGIDSIKKAQLLGELRDHFDISASSISNLTLDQFPTLRHIVEFLRTASRSNGQPASAAKALPIAAAPAPSPVIATQPIRPIEPPAVEAESAEGLGDLEQFLVTFVVDQTGYPPELVELDADLEADLGIDSIKKAQLFGELRDHFDIASVNSANLTLDQFPTLRHIVEFLRTVRRHTGREPHLVGIPASAAASAGVASELVVPAAPAVAGDSEPASPIALAEEVHPWNNPRARENHKSSVQSMLVYRRAPMQPVALPSLANGTSLERRLLRLQGTPYEMGIQQATAWNDELSSLLAHWTAEPMDDAAVAERAVHVEQAAKWLGDSGIEELRGLAEGLGVPLQLLVAWNLANDDSRDSSVMAAAVDPRYGLELVLASSDATLQAADDEREWIATARTKSGGHTVTLFGLPGQLGAHAGVSSRGVAILGMASRSKSQIATKENGSAGYVSGTLLIRTALEEAATCDEALSLIQSCGLRQDWSFLVADTVAQRATLLEQKQGRWTKSSVEQSLLICENDRCEELHTLWQSSSTGERTSMFRFDPHTSDVLVLGPRRVTAHLRTASTLAPHLHRRQAWNFSDLAVPCGRLQRVAKEHLAELPAESERIGKRYTLKVSPAELKLGKRHAWQGSALVLGDNLASRALVRQLKQQGIESLVLNPELPIAELLAAVDAGFTSAPLPHLFLMQGRDSAARCELQHSAWQARKHAGLLAPFAIAQRWHQLAHQHKLLEDCTLSASVALGGEFGLTGASAVEGAGIAGMIKSVLVEARVGGIRSFRAKIVDSPDTDSPEVIARQLLDEITSDDSSPEVAYRDGRRGVVRIVAEAASQLPRQEVPRGGVWVATGGARGVTAVAVRELAARYGWRLHLLGTSPTPQIDPKWANLDADGSAKLKRKVLTEARAAGQVPAAAWGKVERALEIDRTIRAMQAAGVTATYHQCDVADFEQLAATLDRIRSQDGPITGIVHGAGVESASQFARKKWESVVATLNVKADAAIGLLEATRNDPLECFIGFGSVSGLVGGLGQSDYAMGNYLLCNLMQRIRQERPGCLALGVHWSAFGGVGMAARPESRLALEHMGAMFMSPEEGVAHLVDEFERGLPCSQVAICEPNGKVAARLVEQAITNDAAPSAVHGLPPPSLDQQSPRLPPLLDGIVSHNPQESLLAKIDFKPKQDPFLWHHRLYGKPFLPAVMSLEALVEAAELLAGRQSTAICNVALVNGLAIPENETREASVSVQKQAGHLACQLTNDLTDRKGRTLQKDRLIASAEIKFLADQGPLEPWPATEPPLGLFPAQYVDFAPIYHGPPFRRLQSYFCQHDGGYGELIAEGIDVLLGRRGAAGARIPAAVLDACFFACGVFTFWMFEKRVDVPHSLACLRLGRLPNPGERLKLRFIFRGPDGPHMKFDFQTTGNGGDVIFQVDGYRSISLSQGWK